MLGFCVVCWLRAHSFLAFGFSGFGFLANLNGVRVEIPKP